MQTTHLVSKAAIAALLLATSMSGIADEPKSRAGAVALERFNAAKSKMDSDYAARLALLTRTLNQELTAAMRAATRAGDLEEANAIKAAIEKLIGKTQSFQVDAIQDWQPTVPVRKGSRITIEAEGQWSADKRRQDLTCDADGVRLGDRDIMYLEGRIGEGSNFRIGRSTTLVAHEDGVLRLRGFDINRRDNSGVITAQVSVREP